MTKLDFNAQSTAMILEAREVPPDQRRLYLGMSSIANKCVRALWYGFHWATKQESLPIRTVRIFERGDIEEARVIRELNAIGVAVYRKTPDGQIIGLTGAIGEEQEELIGFAGHCKGHPDGRARGFNEWPDETCLLEIKTAKASKFREFVKSGVRLANPTYYGQTIRYMGQMGLQKCFFVVTNKDTEERYYEWIDFDMAYYKELKSREALIVTAIDPPEKLSENPHWIDCKWCNHRDVCHGGSVPARNCRTCEFSDIEDGGVWSCSHEDGPKGPLTYHEQYEGCHRYRRGWGL